MFTTANSSRLSAAIRLALLAAASLAAERVETNAQTPARASRGGGAARQQKSAARLPAFGDYPARDSFAGRPAPVRLRTRRDREFRTRLREGAAEGPNFAGSYTVVYWGCGSGCAQVAVVDAKTGLVYWPPLRYADIPAPAEGEYGRPGYVYGVGYRRDSRLLVLTDTHYDRDGSYTAYFYVFDGRGFRLVREAILRARTDEAEEAPPRKNDPVDPKL
jgi:hypothetical protein